MLSWTVHGMFSQVCLWGVQHRPVGGGGASAFAVVLHLIPSVTSAHPTYTWLPIFPPRERQETSPFHRATPLLLLWPSAAPTTCPRQSIYRAFKPELPFVHELFVGELWHASARSVMCQLWKGAEQPQSSNKMGGSEKAFSQHGAEHGVWKQ